jgi:hypothetical protein
MGEIIGIKTTEGRDDIGDVAWPHHPLCVRQGCAQHNNNNAHTQDGLIFFFFLFFFLVVLSLSLSPCCQGYDKSENEGNCLSGFQNSKKPAIVGQSFVSESP